MKQYLECLNHVMKNGVDETDRTVVGTRSVFGYQMRFDLNDGFPAVTTKRLAWKAMLGELLWMLEGSTDERRLAELTYGKPRDELIDKTTVWTANADAQGKSLGYTNTDVVKELGPVYGYQMRNVNGADQIINLIDGIKNDPYSRRHIVNLWNVEDLEDMALPPCTFLSQFYVRNNKLSCQTYARSQDLFLGTPFNIASYALLTHLLARECGLGVGELVHTTGDAHVYHNHFDQVKLQLQREPDVLPSLQISDDFDLIDRISNGFKLDDTTKFVLKDYNPQDSIKAPMAV